MLGDEELLVERAVAGVLRAARKQAGTDDVPVDRLRAGEVSTSELAELLSPSLFADERVVVLEAAAEAGKDAVALIAAAAADLPPGTVLVVVHSGGGRAKALADQLKNLGAQVHPCARSPRPPSVPISSAASSARCKVKVNDDTVTAVLDARRLRHPRAGVGVLAAGRRHRRSGRCRRRCAATTAARPR